MVSGYSEYFEVVIDYEVGNVWREGLLFLFDFFKLLRFNDRGFLF